MQIFKFGGASVSTTKSIINAANIIKSNPGPKVIVISAMGKTTNALEEVAKAYFNQDNSQNKLLDQIYSYHHDILEELDTLVKSDWQLVEELFNTLRNKLKNMPSMNFDYEYDQIVSFGELISTSIISTILNELDVNNKWIDIRKCFITDSTYREGIINWELTSIQVKKYFNFNNEDLYITQGFLGGTTSNQTTTLGREGSDYSAAILGNILDADNVTIWKNVPGILNADPDYLPATKKLDELSYREAIELSYSGAKVIHPKTIKPLQNKNIPLLVKSFDDPQSAGTIIHEVDHQLRLVPVFIIKKKQALITLSPNDFSFISINSVSDIFTLVAKYRLKVSLIQQSAIDLSLAFDEPEKGVENLIQELSGKYETRYNTGLDLITIRYYTDESIQEISKDKKLYIEQKSRRTARLLLK